MTQAARQLGARVRAAVGAEVGAAVAYLGRHPRQSAVAAVATLVALAVALLAPETTAGGIAALLVVGGVGAAAVWLRTRWPAPLPPWFGRTVAVLSVCWAAFVLFDGRFDARWLPQDWGTHHAIVTHLVDALDHGRIPHWAHGLSSGDSPYELYPAVTVYLAAGVVWLTGMEHDIPLVLANLAVFAHLLIAIGVARLSARLASWPLAAAAGLLALFDLGDGANGGASAVLHWGLLHNAVAIGLLLVALVAVVDSLERPRLRTAALIWLATASGTATHPTGLVMALACLPALAAVAVLATDVRPRRALIAAVNLTIGAGLGAIFWMPLTQRLLAYGVHYGSAPDAPIDIVTWMLTDGLPRATFAAAIAIGWLGMVGGVFSRRAAPTFVGTLTIALLALTSELPYTFLELGPSPELARFSAPRLLSLAKPLVLVCAAYAGALVCAQLATAWRGAPVRRRMLAGAAGAVLLLWLLRGLLPFLDNHAEVIRADAQDTAETDADGLGQLVAWARAQRAEMTPDRFARLLYDGNRNLIYHVNAESDLPTLSIGATSDLMLRERMIDRSPDSLRRYNVRWVIKQGDSPTLGDPATEQHFGTYVVRALPEWDGQFARVERGAGQVRVTRLDDEQVDIELSGTDQPALVALGTGYYPRWRAHAADVDLPVYALRATPGDNLKVVAAWVPPGRTSFTPDGSLPSDGDGCGSAALALLLAVASVVGLRVRRLRRPLLRHSARGLRWLRRRRRLAVLAAVGAATAALLAAAIAGALRRAPAVRMGTGLVGAAEVEARIGEGDWRTCDYSMLRGSYRCADLVHVEGAVEAMFDGEPPSWQLVSPALRMTSENREPVQVRVTLPARLDGDYVARVLGGTLSLQAGRLKTEVTGEERALTLADTRSITLTAEVGAKPLLFALIDRADIDPERRPPVAPVDPPACVRDRLPSPPCDD